MRRRAVTLVLTLCLVAACATDPGAAPPEGQPGDGQPADGQTADRAAIAASLSEDDARDLATRVNAFGFDLLHELVGAQGPNVVISPVSVATLLAMVLAGADGQTAEDMAAALHLEDPGVGSAHAGLLFTLTETSDVTLEVANSLWIDAPMEADYLERVRTVFDATAEEGDLGDQATADRIDEWVVEHTHGLIDGIAQDLGLPNGQAVLALLNALYFQGTWTIQFDPDQTTDAPFSTGAGGDVTVPMMHHGGTAERFGYADVDGTQVLRLPYGASERFAMDVVLPPEGEDLADVVAGLDDDAWAALTAALSPAEIQVSLPRLDLSYDADLVEPLAALGMGVVFSGAADLTPMSPVDPSLDTVAHATAIVVDESGTEAAAVTGGVGAVSAPPTFRADRPFLFAVTDTQTGAVLFLGAVTDPTT
ncbi:MAG: serpin family protein [Egibacteraceae bacterium]